MGMSHEALFGEPGSGRGRSLLTTWCETQSRYAVCVRRQSRGQAAQEDRLYDSPDSLYPVSVLLH